MRAHESVKLGLHFSHLRFYLVRKFFTVFLDYFGYVWEPLNEHFKSINFACQRSYFYINLVFDVGQTRGHLIDRVVKIHNGLVGLYSVCFQLPLYLLHHWQSFQVNYLLGKISSETMKCILDLFELFLRFSLLLFRPNCQLICVCVATVCTNNHQGGNGYITLA